MHVTSAVRSHVKPAVISDQLKANSLRLALPWFPHLRFQQPNPTLAESLKLCPDIVNQHLNLGPVPDYARQILPTDGRGTGKDHRLDPPHPCAPTLLLRQIRKLPVKQPLACRGVLALFGRSLGFSTHGAIP